MSIAAMEKALEFISSVKVHPTQIASRDALHDTLRTAIAEAEKQKPVAWRYKGNLHKFDPSDWASPEFPITPLYTAPPAQPAARQEPVAWRYTNIAGVSVMHWHKSAKLDADIQAAKEDPLAHKVTPLYTTPPAAPVQDDRDWSLLEATQESLREHMAEIKRLKAIIEAAEKQEPYGYVSIGNSPVFRKEKPEIGRWKTVYTTPPAAQPAPVQDPVLQEIEQYRLQMAGISTAAIGYWKEGDGIHPDYDTPALRDVAKLYAKYDALYTAAQRQPLTDEQIELGRRVLSCFDLDLFMAGARFAEAAHGIKEKNT
jgi:hypothetical protein